MVILHLSYGYENKSTSRLLRRIYVRCKYTYKLLVS